jgi:multiple sugar transport system permease protein
VSSESVSLVDKPRLRRRGSAQTRARRVEVAALVIPALIPILIFSVAPLLSGIALAFTDASLRRNETRQFVGLTNFQSLFGDTMFWGSFQIGMVWAVSVTWLQLVAGLVLALLLNANLRFQGLARVLALIPWAMPPVVVAIMWQLIYATNGPLNAVLSAFGPEVTTNWLGDFSTALPAVIVVGVWVGMPQTTITLLASLQQIPTEQVEDAAMDGANAWKRFAYVSLPAIRPVMTSITSLNFIWNFNSFGLIYVLTEGGPGGRTMLPMLFTYLEAFKSRNLGYASAMGCVLVLIVVLLLAIYLWSQFREKEVA